MGLPDLSFHNDAFEVPVLCSTYCVVLCCVVRYVYVPVEYLTALVSTVIHCSYSCMFIPCMIPRSVILLSII